MVSLVFRNQFLHRLTLPHQQDLAPKQMEASKSEIQNLEFERSILSHSIVSAYEFMQGGERSSERDRLVTKYQSQLDNINEKISELQLSVEFTELSEARNKLASLVQSKISSLDAKIDELSRRYGLSADHLQEHQEREFLALPEEKKTYPNAIEAKGDVAKVAEVTQIGSDDMAVKEVQEEILQALSRLENVGTDYELLTESNQPELENSKGKEIVTSYPVKAFADRNSDSGKNVPDNVNRMRRDAVSSITNYEPT